MFWNKNKDDELYIRCDIKNDRSAYRVDPGHHGSVVLLVDGERARIHNISATGIAFDLEESSAPDTEVPESLQGILFIGQQHNPIPVMLHVVSHEGTLFRCRITHNDLLAQKKLSAAIIDFQKQQIRAQTQIEPVSQANPEQNPG